MTAGPVTLIAGPTASGKSALALAMAERDGAHIVNTDSMQVYDVLRLLTARPVASELARAPHHLYGHVSPATLYSTGQWMRDVQALLAQLPAETPLIFVGGTGLYFRALTEGLAPMPDIPASVRDTLRARLAAEGAPALHAELDDLDADTARTLASNDGQRIVRALEVLHASGRSIREWQAEKAVPILDATQIASRYVLNPERQELNERINARFDQMVSLGALEEVRDLLALDLNADLPAMKAIGVRELGRVLADGVDPDEAMAAAKTATRQYAKRQATWFRNQFGPEWQRHTALSEPGSHC